ncbi:MAG: hypothetical protein ACR65X_13095 [Methylocystis sp.]
MDWTAVQKLPEGLFIVVLLSRLTGLPRQTFWQLTEDEMMALVAEVKIPDEISESEKSEWFKRLPPP